jgi:hypothetical protein
LLCFTAGIEPGRVRALSETPEGCFVARPRADREGGEGGSCEAAVRFPSFAPFLLCSDSGYGAVRVPPKRVILCLRTSVTLGYQGIGDGSGVFGGNTSASSSIGDDFVEPPLVRLAGSRSEHCLTLYLWERGNRRSFRHRVVIMFN